MRRIITLGSAVAVSMLCSGAMEVGAQQAQAPMAMPAPALGQTTEPYPGVRTTTIYFARLTGTEAREVAQLIVDFAPGAATARHKHPGDEVAHVLEGSIVFEMHGVAEPATFRVGQTFHPHADTPHVARNASNSAPAKLIVTSILVPGQPRTILVP